MNKQIEIKEEDLAYIKSFYYVKGFASARDFQSTLKALPLARKVHEGQHRQGTISVNGKERQIPYLTHALDVTTFLMAVDFPLTHKECDDLYAAALLHDVLEDRPDLFPEGGEELVTRYGISREALTIIQTVSKRSGATQEELAEYFERIKRNKLALLLKLADRGDNAETMNVMKVGRFKRYIDETRKYIYPIIRYGKQAYPELSNGLTILKSKIVSLTEASEALMYKFAGNSQPELPEKHGRVETRKELSTSAVMSITLLSIEEYWTAQEHISPLNDWWWLRSPGSISDGAACAVPDGGAIITDHLVYDADVAVRPVLRIDPESVDLRIGDKFRFGGKTWTYIAEGLALSDEAFCKMPFREDRKAEDANVYKASDVKAYLDGWLRETKDNQGR